MVNYIRAYYRLQGLMRRAYWTSDVLQKYQNEKLRQIIRYAYDHVPFYRKKFTEAGIEPKDISALVRDSIAVALLSSLG